MSMPLSPHPASLRYSENPKSAPMKWKVECYVLEKLGIVKFVWQTYLLMKRLAKSEYMVSCYDPEVQAWAAQLSNVRRYRSLCKEELKVQKLVWEGGSKMLVVAALRDLRLMPFGKRLASMMLADLSHWQGSSFPLAKSRKT